MEPGEAAVLRNVGDRVNPAAIEMIKLLQSVTQAAGGRGGPEGNIIVLHHTDCGIKHCHQQGDGWELDPLITDERYLAVNVRGKGLVVFSACSHAGVVNVLHEVRRRFPGIPIHALIGGYHLSGGSEAVIDETVADFAQFAVDLILPGHCTGWRTVNALERAFGPKVVPIAVGMRIDL